jgi:hypothetical protein
MAGLVDLVPVAEVLTELSRTPEATTVLATKILATGAAALPRRGGDTVTAARHLLTSAGVIDAGGTVNRSRAAELVVVCEILAATSPPSPPPMVEPRLVLSAPAGKAPIADIERLEGLVLDVLRRATTSIHIGGAFWNGDGFQLLNDVLLPALELRQTATTLYVNPPEKRNDQRVLETQIAALRATGAVTVLWFTGARPTMLHAKFVIGNRTRGYLGTANLTSWGLHGGHVEAGVELTPGQCERFVVFLEQLCASGMFVESN